MDDGSGLSVRCRSKSISVHVVAAGYEIEYGGEAMSQVVAHLCTSRSMDNATDVKPEIYGLLPGLKQLMIGAVFMSASATAREGGCDLSAKVHGAYVPIECKRNDKVAQVRIGGSASSNGTRTGRLARPALEVSFHSRLFDAGPELSPCSCVVVRDVLTEASMLLFSFYDQSAVEEWYQYALSLFIVEGMSGKYPPADSSLDPKEFVFKHIGACFRQALFSGTEDAFLTQSASKLVTWVGVAKLLVHWKLEDLNWASTGVIIAFRYVFQLLVSYSEGKVVSGSVSPTSPLCTLQAPSSDHLAEEAENPRSSKNLVKVLHKIATQLRAK